MSEAQEMTFDPQEFAQTAVNEVFETRRTPIDAKDYDNAYIKVGSVEFRGGVGKDSGKVWRKVSMYFQIDDAEQREKTGLDEPGASYEFFLDVAADGKTLLSGPNRNTDLGNLRDALGQNSAPWSFSQLDGAGPVRIRVGHDTNKDDATKVRAVVRAVSKQ